MKKFTAMLLGTALTANLFTSAIVSNAAEAPALETVTPVVATTENQMTTTAPTNFDYGTTTTTAADFGDTTVTCVTDPTYDLVSPVFKIICNGDDVPDTKFSLVEYDWGAREDPDAEPMNVIAEWNSSDANPYVVPGFYPSPDCDYALESEDLPDGYSYDYCRKIKYWIDYYDFYSKEWSGDAFIIPVDNRDAIDFPTVGDVYVTFCLYDCMTGDPLGGIDLELYKFKSFFTEDFDDSECVGSFTTGDDGKCLVKFPYYFEDLDDGELFGFKIVGDTSYDFADGTDEQTGCLFFTLTPWDIYGFEGDMTFYLRDANAPVITTETTAPVITSTTTYVTTNTYNTTTIAYTTTAAPEHEVITDVEKIRHLLELHIDAYGLAARIVSEEEVPEEIGNVVVVEYYYKDEDVHTALLKYIEDNNIDADLVQFMVMESAVSDDIDTIREKLESFIAENGLDARITTDEEYQGYQPLVFEYNTAQTVDGKSLNILLIEYAEENNIDLSNVGFIPVVNGEPMTTTNPNAPIVTTTTTTTTTVTTDMSTTTSLGLTTTTVILTDMYGRLVDENGNVIIINGTSAVMSRPATTTTTTTTTDPASDETTETSTTTTGEDDQPAASTTTTTAGSEDGQITTTTAAGETGELPQTGYPEVYKWIAETAFLITVGGALVIMTSCKKKREE